jgi:hypothetical protein
MNKSDASSDEKEGGGFRAKKFNFNFSGSLKVANEQTTKL